MASRNVFSDNSKNLTESQVQSRCVKWFREVYPDIIIFAIGNGGWRKPREAARLKREGVLAGIPDLFVAWPNDEGYPGLFIEMKTKKGTLSALQKKNREILEHAGYKVEVCRSIQDFVRVVQSYIDQHD